MTSRSAAVSGVAVPHDHLALGDVDADRWDVLGGPVPSPGSVSVWLNDEFGTISGRMISAASMRSTSSRSPPIRPAMVARVSATSVSRSSVRSVASRTRAASVRTAAQRGASNFCRVAWAVSLSPGIAVSRRAVRSSADRSVANAVSTRRTRSRERIRLLVGDGDGVLGREVELVAPRPHGPGSGPRPSASGSRTTAPWGPSGPRGRPPRPHSAPDRRAAGRSPGSRSTATIRSRRSDGRPRGVVAREPRQDRRALGQHQ